MRLSLEERETISRGLAQNKTLTAIAAELGRAVSTISREVRRNSGPNGYRAARADRLAIARTARSRPGKLAGHAVLREYVEGKLALCWSPRQISCRLVIEFPDEESMRVSHETIYTSLFVQSKAVLRTELTKHLRTGRVRRRPHRRVSNENTNGLLRQYFPKKTDLALNAPEQLQKVVDELNSRPREVLGWQTPHEVFQAASVAMIA